MIQKHLKWMIDVLLEKLNIPVWSPRISESFWLEGPAWFFESHAMPCRPSDHLTMAGLMYSWYTQHQLLQQLQVFSRSLKNLTFRSEDLPHQSKFVGATRLWLQSSTRLSDHKQSSHYRIQNRLGNQEASAQIVWPHYTSTSSPRRSWRLCQCCVQ